MSLLNKFENKYIIKGILKAEAPIHIGTGTEDFSPTAVDNGVIRDENGNPFIPGSSLKGVLRSFLERIMPSDKTEEEYWACDILSKPCVDKNFLKSIKDKIINEQKTEEEIAKKIYDSQCDVCKLFGGNAFASKIHISDCKLIDNKAYTQIRDGVAIDRDTLTGADGKKYDFECVAAGTAFKFEMTIDNLDDEQKEFIKITLGYLESGDMKVGGKTSAGLGNVKLINRKIYKIERKNLKEYYMNGLKNNEEKFKGDL